MKDDLSAGVAGYGEAEGICGARRGHPRAAVGMAQVAEVLQGSVVRNEFVFTWPRAAGSAEAAAQRQAVGKRPANREGSLLGEKVRTSHDRSILVPACRIV
jgi:hypothetical protein